MNQKLIVFTEHDEGVGFLLLGAKDGVDISLAFAKACKEARQQGETDYLSEAFPDKYLKQYGLVSIPVDVEYIEDRMLMDTALSRLDLSLEDGVHCIHNHGGKCTGDCVQNGKPCHLRDGCPIEGDDIYQMRYAGTGPVRYLYGGVLKAVDYCLNNCNVSRIVNALVQDADEKLAVLCRSLDYDFRKWEVLRCNGKGQA